jgi:predicted N-acyltransferase
MNQLARNLQLDIFSPQSAAVGVLSLADVRRCRRWERALASERKDHRYYEIVEETIRQGFDYHYFDICDSCGEVRAIVPFFRLDLDLLAGLPPRIHLAAEMLRRWWPRFMQVRTVMVGCAAGEGHLDDADELSHAEQAQRLSATVADHAAELQVRLIVFKEFPAKYRDDLECLVLAGFTRVPSLPMTVLDINYPSFEDFMSRTLSSKTRKDLRVKFRRAAAAAPIELSVVHDITPMIEEIYPLYLQVYERAQFRFELLTKEYLCRLGRTMPDKTRFFIWRQHGRAVAFSLCMVHKDEMFGEYVGFDYAVALDLHLYHYAFRDVVTWAMAHGYKTFRSNGANYDPKLHLRFRLDPVDLYVRHVSKIANFMLSKLLRYLVPVPYDPILARFPNFDEVWDGG